MKKWVSILALWMFTSAACATTASDQLAQLLSGIHTMQATFLQVAVNDRGGVVQRASGAMALKRPGRFRWDVLKPQKQIIIADGKYVWVYDVDLEQATRREMDYRHSNSPAMLLSGSMDNLQKHFQVKRLKKRGNGDWFMLKSKASEGMFAWVQLHFKRGELVGMHMANNLGQQSVISFKNMRVNRPINSSLFHFRAPKGVDVIHD